MNSVDNALGMAVLNSQVYPEVLPMNEVAAYFYSKLYHINNDIDVFLNANFDSLFDFENCTTYTGDNPISDANVLTFISNCAGRMDTGYRYYTWHADDIELAYEDISYGNETFAIK